MLGALLTVLRRRRPRLRLVRVVPLAEPDDLEPEPDQAPEGPRRGGRAGGAGRGVASATARPREQRRGRQA